VYFFTKIAGSQLSLARRRPSTLAPVYVLHASNEASYISRAEVAVTGGHSIV
jgi:hypothetical protein